MGMSDYLLNKSSLSSPSVQPLGYAPEVSRLANQISRQRQRANNPQPEGPGLIQRIFDVVSRPLYASANAVDYTLQGKDALTGAWKGLSGQDKTTYDKVLGDMGLSGGWQRSLAGLGLDVALDPTTYVGAGIVKNTAEGAARKAATEIVLTGADEVIGKKAVEKAAQGIYDAGSKTTAVEAAASKEARAKALLNMPGAGNDITSAAQSLKSAYSTLPEKVMNVTHDVTMPEAKTIAKEQAQKTLANKMQQSFDEKLAEGKGRVVLKFAGKDTGIGSTGLYNIGSKAAQLAGKSESLQIINRAFRPVATFKGGTNDLLREAMGHSLFDGEEALKQIKGWFGNSTYQTGGELWGGLSKGERELISHSIEDGTDLSGHLVTTTGRTLEDYKQRAQMIFRNLHATEDELGVSSAKNALDNYVYHSYKGGDKEIKAQFKAARNKAGKVSAANLVAEPGSTLTAVKVPTLKEAADAGLKPETDIMNALGERTIKSFRGQAHARFMRAVEGEFGVPLASTTKGTALKKKGAGDLGKAMGLKPYDSPHFVNKRTWFDPEIHSSLEAADKLHYNPHFSSEIARHFDKVQGIWKLNMTALNPGHHVRNAMGDTWLNFLDGVTNPARYSESARVLKNWKDAPEAVRIRVGDRILNAADVMREFIHGGGKSGFFRTEFVDSGLKPIERIRELAETREDWTRLAHFIDVLKKEGAHVKTPQELRDVAREAGKRVRKFNIDYGDLTEFERNTMKRAVPFYTWIRKNIPLELEALALQPGKVAVIPKSLRALQGITGQGPDDSMFGLNLVPKWLRDVAGVRVAGEGQGRNATYWNPSVIPFMDIQQYFGGGPQEIVRTALGSTTPFLRGPIEYGTGRSLLTGGPLQDTGLGYAGSNIIPPTVPRVSDLVQGKGDATDLAKLFGLSLYNVGPQQQLGELRRQQDSVQAILKSRKPKQPRSWEVKANG